MDIEVKLSFKEKIRSLNFAMSTARVKERTTFIGDSASLAVNAKAEVSRIAEGRSFLDPVEQAMASYEQR